MAIITIYYTCVINFWQNYNHLLLPCDLNTEMHSGITTPPFLLLSSDNNQYNIVNNHFSKLHSGIPNLFTHSNIHITNTILIWPLNCQSTINFEIHPCKSQFSTKINFINFHLTFLPISISQRKHLLQIPPEIGNYLLGYIHCHDAA